MKKVTILGAGAWGTALAVACNRAGCAVTLWSRNARVVELVKEKNVNELYLPEAFIDSAIRVTSSLEDACDAEVLLVAIPSQYVRMILISLSNLVDATVPVVICSKGIERGSLALMSEVIGDVLPNNPVAVLSGPNFADEVARGLPTASTLACADHALGEHLMYSLGSISFRPYLSDDVIGAQIGGAVKNVIALACGIVIGKQFGQNALAALMTRSLAEMRRLVVAKGGKEETLMGLSGIGDMMLTCSSVKSRNTSAGIALAQGKTVAEIIGERMSVAEGLANAESIAQLAEGYDVSMPICSTVHRIVSGALNVEDGIRDLVGRPFTVE
jgi:glycerol-3-phosphate dehydrogenase (NAD(P)+)